MTSLTFYSSIKMVRYFEAYRIQVQAGIEKFCLYLLILAKIRTSGKVAIECMKS